MSVARLEVASRLTSARAARDWLTAELGSWGSQGARDTAVLVLSEIVTNAVRHAHGRTIMITVSLRDRNLLVEVQDESPSPPIRRRAGEVGGWGLRLIDRLSNRWGVDQHSGDGKTVWFEMNGHDADDPPALE